MAWTSDTHDASAGKFIDVLDALLVAVHGTWSVYDAGMPANEKVYRCYDPAADPVVDFYLHVKDNQADFVEILMYDSWDNVGHSYAHDTGCKIIYGAAEANVPYICKMNGGYYFSSHDHRFIYIDKTEWEANYVGMLEHPVAYQRPFIQRPVMIVSSTGYASGLNPLGRIMNVSTLVVSMAMMGIGGDGMIEARMWGYSTGYRYYICPDGGAFIRPTWIYDPLSLRLLGRLRNVMSMYSMDLYDNDDTVTINGVVWRYVEGTDATGYACFIKQE